MIPSVKRLIWNPTVSFATGPITMSYGCEGLLEWFLRFINMNSAHSFVYDSKRRDERASDSIMDSSNSYLLSESQNLI